MLIICAWILLITRCYLDSDKHFNAHADGVDTKDGESRECDKTSLDFPHGENRRKADWFDVLAEMEESAPFHKSEIG